jgi:hypothetical protein
MLTIALLLVLASCGEQEQSPQLDEEQAARESAEQQVEGLEQELEEESAAREEAEERLEEESAAREEAEEQIEEALDTVEETDETAESEEPIAEPEDSDSGTVGVGETFSYDVFDVTLSNPRVEEQRTDAIFGDSVVGPFLVADLTLTNQGGSYESINPFIVTLYTDETSTDDIFQETVGEEEDPFQDVAPGATREGVLAIEFDQNQSPLFVGFSEGLEDAVRVELTEDLAEVEADDPGANPEAEAEEAAVDYYQAAGSEDWQYTYDYLDSETQTMFTEGEWFQKNQWFADADSTIYHIDSVEMESTSDEPVADVELSLTSEDGSSWTRTTYFVLEEGVWKHRFSQEETDHFMPGTPLDEFVAAHSG